MGKLITLPVRQGTDEWLEMRRTGITASEMPVLTGTRPGLWELWADKADIARRSKPSKQLQSLFDLGHAMEPLIAEQYQKQTGRRIRRVTQMCRHPEKDWAFASLDRVVVGEERIVEIKWAPIARWRNGPPAYVLDQVQWQMYVTGYPQTDVVVLNGGTIEIHEVPADHEYQENLYAIADWFRDLVARKEPPPTTDASAKEVIAALYPIDRGGDLICDPETYGELMRGLRDATREEKAAAEKRQEYENRIKLMLGDAPGVKDDFGTITWNTTKPTRRTDWEQMAKDLLRDKWGDSPGHDKAIESYTETRAGHRVFRAIWEEDETWR